MKTRTKIRIDRLVGLPAVLLLRGPARLLGAILRRDHTLDPDQLRVVAVAKFFGMGSIIQATPLLNAIKQRCPEARLLFVTSAGNRAFVERLPMVDEILCVDDRGPLRLAWSTLRALAALLRRRVDCYLDLEVYSAYAAILSLLSCARNRMGFCRYSATFKRHIHTHLMYLNTRMPIRRAYLQLGRLAGIEATPEQADALGPVRVEEADREALRQKLGLGPSRRYVVVNPNASDLLPERRWPAEHFAELIAALARADLPVVLIGAAGEAAHVAAVLAQVPENARTHIINSAGKLAIGELAALLQNAACVVTNDTGPMHLSIVLGAPTVCLFGPVDPAHYGLDRPNVVTLYQPLYCSPCVHEIDEPPCGGNNLCMQMIGVPEVLAAARRLLGEAGGDTAVTVVKEQRLPLYEGPQGQTPGLVVHSTVPPLPGAGTGAGQRACEACGRQELRLLGERGGYACFACRHCGMQCLDPQPSDAVLASIYGGHYYNAWGIHQNGQSTRQMKLAYFRRQLRALGPLPAGARVVDCGAATGFLMEAAAETGYEPYGVELSEFGAAAIAERFGADRVFQGRFEDAHFQEIGEAGFDAVLMFDFLEHVRDPQAVLRKAHSLLKPGGLLRICTPDAASLSRRLLGRRWLHYKTEHLFYFTPRSIRSLLQRSGFEVQRVTAARKVMNLNYVAHQLATYPRPLITPVVATLHHLSPPRLATRNFSIGFGELAVNARAVP